MRNILVLIALAALAGTATAAEPRTEPPRDTPEQVVEPQIDRRDVVIPRIDTEDFEVGVYGGILSVEDFGSEPVAGVRLAYHVSEDFFLEGVFGKSTVSDQALCDLGLCLFPSRDEDLTYYSLSVGFNFFPGEVFIGKTRAMTSTVYALVGAGNTKFIDEDRFTMNFGIGIRILPIDWLAVHITVRDHLFESDILGKNKVTNNFELTLGLSAYF